MLVALVATLLALGAAKLNLFNLEARSGEVSDDLSQQLGLVSYTGPFGWAAPARPGQERVRVISIDEAGVDNLRDLGWAGWPPGYDNLAILVEDLVLQEAARPRAVFLDLVITGRNVTSREADAAFESLVGAIGGASGGRPSTLFPQPAGSWVGVTACRADPLVMLACMVVWDATPMILAASDEGGQGQARLAEVAVLTPVHVNERNYPLVGGQGASAFLYPAAALYAADCLTRLYREKPAPTCDLQPLQSALAIARDLKAGRPPARAEPTAELAKIWGETAIATVWSRDQSPEQARLLRAVSSREVEPCRAQPDLPQRIRDTMPGWFGAAERRACEYTLWMGYDRIAAGYGLDSATDYPFLLGDRLLIVGARFRDGNDWVRSPLHGAVPGVFYHAMALDNLVELGPDFRRPEREERIGRQDLLTAPLTFILLTMAAYAAMARQAFALDRAPALGGRLPLRAAVPWYALVSLAIVSVAFLYVFLAQTLWARSVVVNWLGVLSIVFAALAAMIRFDLLKDIEVGLENGAAGWIGKASSRIRDAFDLDEKNNRT